MTMNETSYDRVFDAIHLKEKHWPPVVPIVGLYSMRVSGLTAHEILHDGKRQAKSQLASQSRFGYDGVFNVMDLTVEAQALGATAEFPEGAFPYLKSHPLADPHRFEEINSLDVGSTRLSVFTKAIEMMALEIKREVFLSSYVIGPFTLAGHLLGIDNLMELTFEDEDIAAALVGHCQEIVTPYIEAQAEAGSDNIVILDPSASSSLISPKFFENFAYPSLKSMVSHIHSIGPSATLHICGKTLKILEMMADTGADVLSIDSHVGLSDAKAIIGSRVGIMGNVSTTLLVEGTEEEVAQSAASCIDAAGAGGGFILSTSCDIPVEVPKENLDALVGVSLNRFAA
ncbi:hypothetical protein EU522_01060 [Candidatus Thorarchaeota archaeon]|nr:MAG: hypothetical protein EU522_01060 [Candidatus Thorarchaeota archaeon]